MVEVANRTVILLAGVPGNPRDKYAMSLAVRLTEESKRVLILSHHVLNGWKVEMDRERDAERRAQYAFAKTLSIFLKALEDEWPVIIVNQDNLQAWERANYIQSAKLCDYAVQCHAILPSTIDQLKHHADTNELGLDLTALIAAAVRCDIPSEWPGRTNATTIDGVPLVYVNP